MKPVYKKEFTLNLFKFRTLYPLLIPLVFIPFTTKGKLAPTIVAIMVYVIIIGISCGIGYILAYKKITLLYEGDTLFITCQGGYGGRKNKEYTVCLDEVASYKERHLYKETGVLQFVLKDGKVVEFPYTPYTNTMVNLRCEVLRLIDEKNIPKTLYWKR